MSSGQFVCAASCKKSSAWIYMKFLPEIVPELVREVGFGRVSG